MMVPLKDEDVRKVVGALPEVVVGNMRTFCGPDVFVVAGGFVRDTLQGDRPSDIDMFVAEGAAGSWSPYPVRISGGGSPEVVGNRYTVVLSDDMLGDLIQVPKPLAHVETFDFTVCCAGIYAIEEGEFAGRCHAQFYDHLRTKELVPTSWENIRPRQALRRLLKLHGRGYKIGDQTLAGAVAAMVMGTQLAGERMLEEEKLRQELERILTGQRERGEARRERAGPPVAEPVQPARPAWRPWSPVMEQSVQMSIRRERGRQVATFGMSVPMEPETVACPTPEAEPFFAVGDRVVANEDMFNARAGTVGTVNQRHSVSPSLFRIAWDNGEYSWVVPSAISRAPATPSPPELQQVEPPTAEPEEQQRFVVGRPVRLNRPVVTLRPGLIGVIAEIGDQDWSGFIRVRWPENFLLWVAAYCLDRSYNNHCGDASCITCRGRFHDTPNRPTVAQQEPAPAGPIGVRPT